MAGVSLHSNFPYISSYVLFETIFYMKSTYVNFLCILELYLSLFKVSLFSTRCQLECFFTLAWARLSQSRRSANCCVPAPLPLSPNHRLTVVATGRLPHVCLTFYRLRSIYLQKWGGDIYTFVYFTQMVKFLHKSLQFGRRTRPWSEIACICACNIGGDFFSRAWCKYPSP